MDMHMIVKVVAILAVLFLVYKLWESMNKPNASPLKIQNPYEKYMNSAEGGEYDAEDDDIYYPETDAEDDDIYTGETDDMYDGEDDDIYVQEGDDIEDAEDEPYDDSADMEQDVPKVQQPMMPLLTPSSQLLPKPSPEAADFAQFAPKNLQAQNFLTATQWIGVNTQGSSLKNANYDLRADPIIPKADVGPWMMSSVDPNIYQKPLFG
ncbi:hypothetical protein PBCV1_A352L [Paramecium bursaria Chlorella virus 1]|uniref:Minor capsid protein P11 n=1 Tax=Paramecium bursaria Chlorella virus 1 TaxID=10506 RepID=P11_PBCV1|nr:hypothetical protein PBCV1_A352L [Paramecium bursaria Chlorella virus 1]6NCL_a9 Chain a9, P11 [Paramecium bursaria Chlorella virus 1]6NCL_b0 Chain b0, P11 [Paramecium bursaria Chlorella virus 1]6NCL_b1 Chain b1, P11 [Paramecium bursaria Chlorella virus 1]6NCL_b2 Chain b2, P11 [Paramecium bursaria Chlorella virus 1]6NCL_b3 Chain b3, P11 [Paramecium bursaria Chlorella virus 1]6NCL_b4 Chain b4, P11 [Paramecium bursaria Chlorella virus 1]6NCL_b5 Chain b5, P11 [Paramecium bursaria Chlorella vi